MIDLLTRRVMMAKNGESPARYDAEVSYLQSDGTQYINTGIAGGVGTKIEVKARVITFGIFICGSRGDDTNSITIYGQSNGTHRFGSKSAKYSFVLNTTYEISIDKDELVVAGTSYTIGETTSFTTPTNIFIMHAGTTTNGSCRIYSCKIYQGETLVRDYIPVRKGTIGYLYDKVSKKLFGNDGTGSFTLGNDKT